MALVIKKPKGASNKEKTLNHSPPSIISPSPFIDRLSVVLDVQDAFPHPREVSKALWIALEEPGGPLTQATGGKWGPYKHARRVRIDALVDTKKWPLFQVAYDGKTATQFRIDFVPVDLGASGLIALHAVLQMFLPNGWGDFVKHGRITKIDVTVDFPDLVMTDIMFLPQQLATTTVWKSNGTLQTYQQGKPSGNFTSIYDRGAKRKNKKQSYEGKEGVRVERRFSNPPLKSLEQLPTMQNPFAKLGMCRPLPPKPPTEELADMWTLFNIAVEARGPAIALSALPPHKRTAYKQHLEQHQQSWWNPEAIWSKWNVMLDEMKIADPECWK